MYNGTVNKLIRCKMGDTLIFVSSMRTTLDQEFKVQEVYIFSQFCNNFTIFDICLAYNPPSVLDLVRFQCITNEHGMPMNKPAERKPP